MRAFNAKHKPKHTTKKKYKVIKEWNGTIFMNYAPSKAYTYHVEGIIRNYSYKMRRYVRDGYMVFK